MSFVVIIRLALLQLERAKNVLHAGLADFGVPEHVVDSSVAHLVFQGWI